MSSLIFPPTYFPLFFSLPSPPLTSVCLCRPSFRRIPVCAFKRRERERERKIIKISCGSGGGYFVAVPSGEGGRQRFFLGF